MKKSLPFLFAAIVIIFSSCSQTQQLSDNSLLQKRKYTHGYNLNIKTPWNSPNKQYAQNTRINNQEKPLQNLQAAVTTSGETILPPEELQAVPALSLNPVPQSMLNSDATTEMTKSEKRAFKKEVKEHFASNSVEYKNLKERAKTASSAWANAPVPMVQGGDPPLVLMLIACIIPPLPMAILYGIGWQFWVSLLLCLLFGLELFYLGGVAFIFSLIMVILYYS